MSTISDHALIRWLERRHGFDREAMEREIVELFRLDGRIQFGVAHSDEWRAVVNNGNVVTILSPEQECRGALTDMRATLADVWPNGDD